MFIVEVGATLTTMLFIQALIGKAKPGGIHLRYQFVVMVHGHLR
jgi:hypothetical protein